MAKILIADDEKIIRDVFLRFLHLKGFEVGMACDGTEVLEKLSNERFDLLILDLRMPGVRSSDILRYIVEKKINIPVIILTGTLDNDNLNELLAMGFLREDMLYKPVDLFELLDLVKNKLSQK